MKTIKGDLLKYAEDGLFDVIIHGCNCFHTMGAGIARQIRLKYPSAYMVDKMSEYGTRDKLGTYTAVSKPYIDFDFTIVNAYTQFNMGGVAVEYPAIINVFRIIAKDFKGKRIGYPKIGAGLGGGNWNIISAIIEQELMGLDHTLVLWGE